MSLRRFGFGHARKALAPFVGPRFRWLLALTALVGALLGAVEALILRIIAELAASIEDQDALRAIGPFDSLPITNLIIVGIVCALALVGFRTLESGLIARVGVHPLTRSRTQLIGSLLQSGHEEQAAITSGTFHELVLAHAIRVSSIAMSTATMISAGIVALTMAIGAAIVSPIGFVLLAGVMLLVVAATSPINVLAHRFGKSLASANNELANKSAESVDLATEGHLFGVEAEMAKRLDAEVERVSQIAFRNHATSFLGSSLFQAVMLGLLVVVAGVVASLDTAGFTAAGTVALLVLRGQMAARRAITANLSITNSAPFAHELQDAIARLNPRVETGPQNLSAVETFEAHDVFFTYSTEATESPAVLANLNLTVNRGEHVGIVGPSGSGKSTLLAVLLGLLEPGSGVVRVNGRPFQDYDPTTMRSQIAAVQQRPQLLTGTVADNIRFFRDLTDQDVIDAAAAVGIADEIRSWPDGFDTVIGHRGVRQVSGGQAQRICIARALAGGPSLLIMDEPTSSIDESGETLIIDTLSALGDTCAAIIVSHRLSSLRSCDRVLSLASGRLQEGKAAG